MCMCTRGRHTMVTETSKTINFRVHFYYNTFIYWLANLLINITFFYWQVFQVGERNKSIMKPVSFITHFNID